MGKHTDRGIQCPVPGKPQTEEGRERLVEDTARSSAGSGFAAFIKKVREIEYKQSRKK